MEIFGRSIGTYDTTLKQLCDTYGTDAGFCYFGALAACVEYPSRDSVVSASAIHPRALERRLKKVLDAGLPLTMTKADKPLPPLIIDRDWVLGEKLHRASVMKKGVTLCDYNSETTPANNLVCRAEEKQDVSEHEW